MVNNVLVQYGLDAGERCAGLLLSAVRACGDNVPFLAVDGGVEVVVLSV